MYMTPVHCHCVVAFKRKLWVGRDMNAYSCLLLLSVVVVVVGWLDIQQNLLTPAINKLTEQHGLPRARAGGVLKPFTPEPFETYFRLDFR